MRILVVEDSPTQAEALRSDLEKAGYDVDVASRGEDALARFDPTRIDIVISDIVMPGAVDGYELCRRIKAGAGRHTPVVLLTSLSDPLDIIKGLECGADNFLTKPHEAAHLLERLELLVATKEARAESRLRVGVDVFFLGRKFTIGADREQILDLLVSTFEDAVLQNRTLRQREGELETARADLARYARMLEARLETVLASVPDVLYSMHPGGSGIHYVSPASTSVLGYPPQDLVANPRLWFEILHEDDRASVGAWITDVVRSRQAGRMEYRIRHRDGSIHWLEDTVVPVVDEAETVARLDGIARDVTERRSLEAQYQQAQKMEAVGRLAGGIAHDFNNLLTAIIGNAELLQLASPGSERWRRDLAEIVDAANRAAGLTRQLLAFSRQQVLEARVVNLNEIVTQLERILRRVIGEDIDLVVALAPDLGSVKADPGQLEQVIMNLAVNARDAMPRGGKLTVETAFVELDEAYAREHLTVVPGPYVMLAVSDTGIGMDEATKARIFEPFFTTKEVDKGTGLGLATVYGIVKQSRGNVWVYSEPGRGSTFKIYLPRVDEPKAPLAVVPTAEPVGGTETLLLVEDNEAVRRLARRVLQERGYTVLEAGRGDEAQQLAAGHHGPIALLVTDLVMPGMSGRDLAARLKAERPGLRLLYMSGYTGETIGHHGALEPNAPFLQKPFSPDSLARKVREVLDGSTS